MNKTVSNAADTKIGYFVAFADESKELEKSMLVRTGRLGIYYKKEDLVSTLQSNEALKDKTMDIVEIRVDLCAIINPNGKKFGVKSGKDIPIISIQSFTLATKEDKKMAIA